MDPDESSETNEKTKIKIEPQTLDTKSSTTPAQSPFKIEWSLFWDGLLGDREKNSGEDPLKALTREQIGKLIKDLSAQRKQLHKQIESVNKEMELNSAKLESLQLVGSEPDETIARLNQLSDKGQELSSELHTLNQKLKWVRNHEKEISNKEWA